MWGKGDRIGAGIVAVSEGIPSDPVRGGRSVRRKANKGKENHVVLNSDTQFSSQSSKFSVEPDNRSAHFCNTTPER